MVIRKELTIAKYSLTTSAQVDKKYKNENSVVGYVCVVKLHDYTTDTNDNMTTKTDFFTVHQHEHVSAQSFVCQSFVTCVRDVRFSLDIDLSFLFIFYFSHLLSHFFHFFEGEKAGRLAESSNRDTQIRFLLIRHLLEKSEFSLSARQKLTNTNFKLIMTEEVYEN